jgi:hypothetical protein
MEVFVSASMTDDGTACRSRPNRSATLSAGKNSFPRGVRWRNDSRPSALRRRIVDAERPDLVTSSFNVIRSGGGIFLASSRGRDIQSPNSDPIVTEDQGGVSGKTPASFLSNEPSIPRPFPTRQLPIPVYHALCLRCVVKHRCVGTSFKCGICLTHERSTAADGLTKMPTSHSTVSARSIF